MKEKFEVKELINVGVFTALYFAVVFVTCFIGMVPITPIYETAKRVGSVFQDPRSQFFNVNTTDEIAFAAENQCMAPERITSLISETAGDMQIEKLLDRSIFELSGGEKQIIACAGIKRADKIGFV